VIGSAIRGRSAYFLFPIDRLKSAKRRRVMRRRIIASFMAPTVLLTMVLYRNENNEYPNTFETI
jgi:hypothetical protein